ncbi:alpha/beta hydrolase [Halovulum dunhuangense]|uniref:Alpha/beta hydrolase n=1 Tax=Halovulum dunhuangense TaxID=1505036 RepID=A0A849L3R1_9RHOB|nr:alpha/beta hydrolase [Halovulum dunhuangense]NNU80996.1 alpha/beta hydrolase [Halovulum dunhuangense]
MLEINLYRASDGRSLAYHTVKAATGSKKLPGIVFLGGFRSDMTGTKAVWLEDWARRAGRDFLRFDYTGHGQSSGRFEDGCIGDWILDATRIIEALTEGPQILVGSSMGGWIALSIARDRPEKVAGLVGIAAAPDFTEDSMWAGMDDATRARLMSEGRIEVPTEYAPEPYVITRRLIEDGRDRLVLRSPLRLDCPVRLLHGTADADVAMSVPLRLMEHADCDDLRLTFLKGSDHRLSKPHELEAIRTAIDEVTAALT